MFARAQHKNVGEIETERETERGWGEVGGRVSEREKKRSEYLGLKPDLMASDNIRLNSPVDHVRPSCTSDMLGYAMSSSQLAKTMSYATKNVNIQCRHCHRLLPLQQNTTR